LLKTKRKLGLIVNPIAGMGGRVGLKGTDGESTVQKAMELGALSVSPDRTVEALKVIACSDNDIDLVTYPSDMGEEESRRLGLKPTVIGTIERNHTTAHDTKKAARDMLKSRVDLVLFAGGDGTARDICEAIAQNVPALGIPAGVKIHSGVFAVNPRKAGELALNFLQGQAPLHEAEVMDIDEDAFRRNRVSARLYGYLRVPYEKQLVQDVKSGSFDTMDERRSQEAIAAHVVDRMDSKYYYVLGPGTTVKAIADKLGIGKTLLGVDVVRGGKVVAKDLNEKQLLRLLEGNRAKLILSPIGGQGFVLGRGNQQISPDVIRRIGKSNITIVATLSKLSSIGLGRPLLVDTGEPEVDKMLSGYMRVVTGYNEEIMLEIST